MEMLAVPGQKANAAASTAMAGAVALLVSMSVSAAVWFGDSGDALIIGMAAPIAAFAVIGLLLLAVGSTRWAGLGLLLGATGALVIDCLALAALGAALGS